MSSQQYPNSNSSPRPWYGCRFVRDPRPQWSRALPWKPYTNVYYHTTQQSSSLAEFRPSKRFLSGDASEAVKAYEPTNEGDRHTRRRIRLAEKSEAAHMRRDDIFDVNKVNNPSNINVLKETREKAQSMSALAEFDSQVRSCVANPGLMRSTWSLLTTLFGAAALDDYVADKHYTVDTLSSSVIRDPRFRKMLEDNADGDVDESSREGEDLTT